MRKTWLLVVALAALGATDWMNTAWGG